MCPGRVSSSCSCLGSPLRQVLEGFVLFNLSMGLGTIVYALVRFRLVIIFSGLLRFIASEVHNKSSLALLYNI